MKKIIILLSFILLTVIAVYLYKNNRPVSNTTDLMPTTPTLEPKTFLTVTTSPTSGNQKTTNNFNVEYVIVRDPKKIFLYDNSEEKLSSTEALKKFGCDTVVSGGFWREDNGQPVGLLISEGKVVNKTSSNKLSNGFFYIDSNLKAIISDKSPDPKTVTVALQSGPLLFSQSLPIKLEKSGDENSRRVVVAKTFKDEIVFLVFYYKPSPLIGPKLYDLPSLIDELSKSTNLKVESALNLDGGAHSAFLNDETNITEISRVGSFFCIKP